MSARVAPLVIALGLLLGTALPSAAAIVRSPTSHETAASPVPARGAGAANARSYFGARYYRADIGRFTTVDPALNVGGALLDPQQWNRYAYVSNNPLRFVDPYGLYQWAPSGCGERDSGCQRKYADEQQRFRNGLSELDNAAAGFPAGSPERARLEAARAVYGAEGDPGVTVGFGALDGGAAARTTPDGQGNFLIQFDPGKLGNNGSQWAVAAGHEGAHAADVGLPPAQALRLTTLFHVEYRAYDVSSLVAQGLRVPSLRMDTGFEIWSSNWNRATREAMRAAGIALHVRMAYGPRYYIPYGPWDPLGR